VAATLDADQELLHFSFPISKQEDTDFVNPVDGTPDIWITGKATDGTVDADRQIVDPEWSAVALKEWAATGGNVRMAHDPRRPVGKGHDVQVTMDGHYVKSLISDPLAKHFIRTGVLNDYSIGIAAPHLKFGPHKSLDPRGEATGGIITGRPDGLSKIAELSVVDRGSNFHSRFQITRKSAGSGDDFGFTGKMIGDSAEIAMAAPPALLAKVPGGALLTKAAPAAPGDELVDVSLPASMTLKVTPAILAKMNTLSRQRATGQHDEGAAAQAAQKRDFDRGTGGGVDRDTLPESDFAGPQRSFPIVTQSDVSDALHLPGALAADPAAVRARVRSIARRKGLSVPDDSEISSKGAGEVAGAVAEKTSVPEGAETAVPDVTKEPDSNDAPVKKSKKKVKGPKKLPPWLNKPAGDDDAKDDGEACKSAADHLWAGVIGTSTIECAKCHTTPAQAAGVTASPMEPAPVGELMESTAPASVKAASPTPQSASGASDAAPMDPVPQHREPDGAGVEPFEHDARMPATGQGETPTRLEIPTLKASPEVSALLRFRQVGIDADLGKLHDLTCPAFHPDEAAKYHPFAEISSLIDEGSWQRKSLEAACGPLAQALAMHELTGAALALKGASEADVNTWRLEAHKAFRDANPGVSTYPTPGSISPERYRRALITDGRSASSSGHAGPNTSPVVASAAPNAHSFDRPPLADAHASPSPSFMKWDGGQYPDQQGVPTQLNYAHLEKDKQRMALVQVHDHLSRQFPEVCPLDSVDLSGRTDRPLRGVQPENHPVPATAGIGKGAQVASEAAAALAQAAETGKAVPFSAGTALPPATKAAPEAEAAMFADADVYKSFRKQRKKLGKKVLAGKMTVDEARAMMGRRFAQKSAGITALPLAPADPAQAPLMPVATPLTPDVIKSAMREVIQAQAVPLEAVTIGSYDPAPAFETALSKALSPLLEKIQATDTKLAEAQRVIDAIADQPDPSTASFSGLAFNPVHKTARPAGVTEIAEGAGRARMAVIRELENTVNSASSPQVREAAYASLCKYREGGA